MRLRVIRATAVGLVAAALASRGAADVAAVPTVELVAVAADTPSPAWGGWRLGGLSDLAVTGRAAAERISVATITDRGPNGTADIDGASRRTLLAPGFVPSIVTFDLDLAARGATVSPTAVLPLAGASGRPANGRPNGVGRDEPMLEADGTSPLAASPDGVDTEGLVPCGDGYWACEEYRPSLLRLGADGRIRERHVPAGTALAAADTTVIDDLPAALADRRDNRGFEALAISPDATRVYALLQSPLEHPEKGAARRSGNVRLLVADAATGRPLAEHVYRLGDPDDPDYLRRGCPPDDGKLCAMATVGDGVLVVLEQGDGGLARLYRVEVAGATDTRPRPDAVEPIRDLEAAAIAPVRKRLVADLAPRLASMRRDVLGRDAKGSIKIEGLAVVDAARLLLVNDNDFGVNARGDSAPPRTCFWLVTLAEPLDAVTTVTATR